MHHSDLNAHNTSAKCPQKTTWLTPAPQRDVRPDVGLDVVAFVAIALSVVLFASIPFLA